MPVGVGHLCCEGVPLLPRGPVDGGGSGGDGGLVARLHGVLVRGIEGEHAFVGARLGHAVLTARAWVGQDDFCVYLGDSLFEHGVMPFIARFEQDRPAAVIALIEVADPTAFGVAQLDGDRITRLVEKPRVPPSNMAVAGLYCFTPEVFDVLDGMPPSARGEYGRSWSSTTR